MKNIKKLRYLISFSGKKETSLLLGMIVISALLDTLGVASILPFITVLSSPELIEKNLMLKEMFEVSKLIGVKNTETFLFALGLLFFILLVLSLIFRGITLFLEARFSQMREYEISKRLIEVYLKQPYSWFLNRHSADLGKTILSEVSQVVGGGLKPLINLIAKVLLTFAIITLLIFVDLKITLIVGLFLGISYGLIFKFARGYLNRIGSDRLKRNEERYTIVNEAFGAAKEVKINGLEKFFIDRFSIPAKVYAKNNTSAAVIGQMPRLGLEIIAFGGILLLLLYLLQGSSKFSSALPLISLYVLASYRLLPAVQQIYASLTLMTFVGPSLDKLYEDLQKFRNQEATHDNNELVFDSMISLNNVSYNYPNSKRRALENINIEIQSKTTVGIIGSTGSGKTTTIDIILGLLEPQQGTLEVDGLEITKTNKRQWQRKIGYVPQQVYLSDDTISANIAFGLKYADIDQRRVESASRMANLHEFVISDLPKKYNTKIGERGVRLSGGQRQRIGIARALYHKPQVLILDEATNALDNQTEKAVMDAITNLRNDVTIIIIAHRINTLKKCDSFFLVEKGKILKKKNFEDLIEFEREIFKKN